MKKIMLALLFCLLNASIFAQTIILLEDFEDATVTYTTNVADDLTDIGNSDYFGRIDSESGLPDDISYSNAQGSGFYGVQDTDGANSGNVDIVQLDWVGIDISSFTNLNLSWYVAEDDANDGNEDWDPSDFARLEVQIDGGGFSSVFAIESGSETNTAPSVDTDFDGLGDGTEITDVLAQFSSVITNGTLLDIRLTIEGLSAGDEDLAFDNLLLIGDAGDAMAPEVICPDAVTLSTDEGTCISDFEFPAPVVSDNVSALEDIVVSVIRSDGLELTDAFPSGETIITISATDEAGNTSEDCMVTITVNDEELPTLICSGDISIISDDGDPMEIAIDDPEPNDNCSLQPDLTGVRDDGLGLSEPFPLGTTTITWSISDLAGNLGTCEQIVTIAPFEIPSLSITSFTLIDADTDEPLFVLEEGMSYNINDLPTQHLDIRANTTEDVESVRISLDGALTTARTESLMPFALFRDLPIGDYIGEDFVEGVYSVSAIPYSEDGLGGEMGSPFTINFELVDGDPVCVSLTADVEIVNPTTCSGGGSITIIPSGGMAPYEVGWITVSFTGETLEGVTAGTYSANVYDANGCSILVRGEIEDPELPDVTLEPLIDILVTDLPLVLSGGMPEGGEYSGEGVTAGIFEPSGPGTYEITYTYEDPVTECTNSAVQEISVLPESTNRVISFTLINADTDQELFDLEEGMVIDINSLPTIHLDIRANTAEDVESVRISLDGALTTARTESLMPFALFRDLPIGDYIGEDFVEGLYSVSTIPYSEDNLGGEMGNLFTINFELVDGNPACVSLSAEVEVMNPSTCGGGGSITVIPSGGTPPYEVGWISISFVGETIEGLSAGTYAANVHDANGCSIRVDAEIIDPTLPEVTLEPFAEVFDTDAVFELSGGLPEGGTYSGDGVTDGMFDPSIGPGTYEISYEYMDPVTECSNLASQEIVVKSENQYKIIAFWLVNADNEMDLFEITDGMEIDISELPTTNLDIRAEAGIKVESVDFELSGTQSIRRGESLPPYALFQDLPVGDFIGHQFDLGAYTLSGTTYFQDNLQGDIGEISTIDFEFVDSTPVLTVLGFTLIDAATDGDLFDLTDGMQITLADIPSLFLDIRGNTTDDVESVRLELAGQQSSARTENLEPYALFQDLPIGNYMGNNFEFGVYDLTVTPYSGDNLSGEMGTPLSITFEIVDNLESNSLKISPNQATTLARATFEKPTAVKQILIFDMSGRMIESYNPQYIKSGDDYILDVNFYQQGTYIVKMIDNRGVPYQKQMVVKR